MTFTELKIQLIISTLNTFFMLGLDQDQAIFFISQFFNYNYN